VKAAVDSEAKIFFSKDKNYMAAGSTKLNFIGIGKLFFLKIVITPLIPLQLIIQILLLYLKLWSNGT